MSSVPVVINESLRCRGVGENMAKFPRLKIRHSSSTLRGTCIFPTSSVAFLLLDGDEAKREDFSERIQSFTRVHRKAFVVCVIDPSTSCAMGFVSDVQTRFLPAAFHVLVAGDWAEAADVVVSAADSHSPSALAELSNSLKTFAEDSTSENAVTAILESLGLGPQESALLLDGCGSLAGVVNATAEQLMDFGLDEATAGCLTARFRSDRYATGH